MFYNYFKNNYQYIEGFDTAYEDVGRGIATGAVGSYNAAVAVDDYLSDDNYCRDIKDKKKCLSESVCHYLGKKDGEHKCLKKSLYSTFMYGGMGYGSICLPDLFIDLLFIIIFPPFYVFKHQKSRNFDNILQIITNFMLTCCFYFPGVIHALFVRYGKDPKCGSLFVDNKSNKLNFERKGQGKTVGNIAGESAKYSGKKLGEGGEYLGKKSIEKSVGQEI